VSTTSIRRRGGLSGILLLALAACAAPEGTPSSAEADRALADTLKGLIAAAYDFGTPGVPERMSALYPDTGRVVFASGGQVGTSPDSLRAGIADFWRNAGQNMREAKWVWGDVYLDRLSPTAALLTGSWSIPHIAPTGNPHTIRGAWTALFRFRDGRWMIVSEHLSSPPD